jgi:2,5-diketo-D-gluconate reductase A
MGYERALRAFQGSVGRLGLAHLDLYLLHWPGAAGLTPNSEQHAELRAVPPARARAPG